MSDLLFPLVPGFQFQGGPQYSTSVIAYGGGNELRNSNWVYPLHAYQVSAQRSQADIQTLIGFFHVCKGKFGTFNLKDYADYRSRGVDNTPAATDQVLGSGDGVTVRFPLIKTYSSGSSTLVRPIRKPVTGSILVAVGGTPTTAFTFDATTGEIVFTTAPVTGSNNVTAGFEFYVPCRFDTDQLQMTIEDHRIASVAAPIVEVRQ